MNYDTIDSDEAAGLYNELGQQQINNRQFLPDTRGEENVAALFSKPVDKLPA